LRFYFIQVPLAIGSLTFAHIFQFPVVIQFQKIDDIPQKHQADYFHKVHPESLTDQQIY
jgi:hypothetical protein